MDLLNRSTDSSFKTPNREVVGGDDSPILTHHYLKIASKYVDLLCGLPFWRDRTTEQLFHLLPKKYHRVVPPLGASTAKREAARTEEERMARAVIIGMLASDAQIEEHLSQKFVERLSG